jgi:hypothetical protein
MSPRRHNQRTVYLADAALDYLADAESLSGRLSGIVLRYARLMRTSLPQLNRNQWCAICDANNGCGIDDLVGEDTIPVMLWANVADAPGLGEKWGIDADALVATMRQWTRAEACAAWEAVRKFWQHAEADTDTALAAAGMIPAPA